MPNGKLLETIISFSAHCAHPKIRISSVTFILLENSSSSYGYFSLVPIQFVSPADSSLYVSIVYKHKCLFFLYTVFGVDLSEVHIHDHIPKQELKESFLL
ncbi:hypothetical protein SLE2022_215390 [Rubroshorea leprosula]